MTTTSAPADSLIESSVNRDLARHVVGDEYLFGTDILVAPLMEEVPSRDVYLPPVIWTDNQDGSTYEGARWHRILPGRFLWCCWSGTVRQSRTYASPQAPLRWTSER